MGDTQAIFLMGPTASGKTALAIDLCQQLSCEIISVDSALVYQGMDIGTAKPDAAELAVAPHHLIDFLDPSQAYSAADFRTDALALIEKIHAKGKMPLFVGGTMLYFKALLEGLSNLPAADDTIRQQIAEQAEKIGWQGLHQELSQYDPESAKRIHPNDPQRINRAVEVYRLTGKSLTELTQEKGEAFPYNVKQFAIAPDNREILHKRIEQRFLQMLKAGFEEEVRKLHQRGDLHPDLPSIRCVGYRQMWDYLDNNIDYDEMVFRGIVATRQLAKRQLTWLRGWSDVTWLNSTHDDLLQKTISGLNLNSAS